MLMKIEKAIVIACITLVVCVVGYFVTCFSIRIINEIQFRMNYASFIEDMQEKYGNEERGYYVNGEHITINWNDKHWYDKIA